MKTKTPVLLRVDFFKASGKWYLTEKVPWDWSWSNTKQDQYEHPVTAFKRCLRDYLGDRLGGMTAVSVDCDDSDDRLPFPMMVKDGEWVNK